MNLEQAKLSLAELGDINDPNSEAYKRTKDFIQEEIKRQDELELKCAELFGNKLKRAKNIDNISEDDYYLLYSWCQENIKDDDDCYINNDTLKIGGYLNDGFFIIDNTWKLSFFDNLYLHLNLTKL